MATQYFTEANSVITATIGNGSGGAIYSAGRFATAAVGDDTTAHEMVYPGGMAAGRVLSSPLVTPGDVTLTKPYTLTDGANDVALRAALSTAAECTITIQDLDGNKKVTGTKRSYSGQLTGYTAPGSDATSSTQKSITLVISRHADS